MSRCGPKGSKMVPNGQYNMFLTIWDIFGLIWALLDHFRQNLIFCSKLLWPRSTLCFWGKKLIFVLKGPKWYKWVQMVPNGQKHVILTIWDHLGPFWTTSGHWQACHDRPFLVPNGPFLMPPSHGFMAQWSQNGFESSPHMGQGYSVWKGSQSEHNCVTDGKKSEKSCQKWPDMAQTMAIFRHKWLIIWQKNYFHQYPVDNEFWSSFDPIRISGSTSTGGLLHSLTSPLKQIGSFEISGIWCY